MRGRRLNINGKLNNSASGTQLDNAADPLIFKAEVPDCNISFTCSSVPNCSPGNICTSTLPLVSVSITCLNFWYPSSNGWLAPPLWAAFNTNSAPKDWNDRNTNELKINNIL